MCYSKTVMTQTERDRESLIKDILKMASDYRAANRLQYDDPVMIDIPAGAWHLITDRDVEFLKVFNIVRGVKA